MNHAPHHVRRYRRQRPAQVAMSGVVKHVGQLTSAHSRHHVGHHGAQSCPRHNLASVDAGEALIHPCNERPDAVGANVFVVAVEFGGACNAETIYT